MNCRGTWMMNNFKLMLKSSFVLLGVLFNLLSKKVNILGTGKRHKR